MATNQLGLGFPPTKMITDSNLSSKFSHENKNKMEDDVKEKKEDLKKQNDTNNFNHPWWDTLMSAISDRNEDQLLLLLERDPSLALEINHDELGWNAWMYAYVNNNIFAVLHLMDSACIHSHFDRQMFHQCRMDGSTPLIFAIGRLDFKVVRLILCNSINPKFLLSQTDHEGRTPLIYLCQMLARPIGDITAITFCDSSTKLRNQLNAYKEADANFTELLKIILKFTDKEMLVKKDNKGHSALYYLFCDNRRVSNLELLLSEHIQIQIQDLEKQLKMSVIDYLRQTRNEFSRSPDLWKGLTELDKRKEINELSEQFKELESFFTGLKRQINNHHVQPVISVSTSLIVQARTTLVALQTMPLNNGTGSNNDRPSDPPIVMPQSSTEFPLIPLNPAPMLYQGSSQVRRFTFGTSFGQGQNDQIISQINQVNQRR